MSQLDRLRSAMTALLSSEPPSCLWHRCVLEHCLKSHCHTLHDLLACAIEEGSEKFEILAYGAQQNAVRCWARFIAEHTTSAPSVPKQCFASFRYLSSKTCSLL